MGFNSSDWKQFPSPYDVLSASHACDRKINYCDATQFLHEFAEEPARLGSTNTIVILLSHLTRFAAQVKK